MIRRILLIVMLLSLFIPISAFASQQSGQYYPPSSSDYSKKKFSWELYSSRGVNDIRFTQYDLNGTERGKITLKAKENVFSWVDFSCKGNVSIEFLDANGKVLSLFSRGQALSHLDDRSCNYKTFVKASNYDAKARKYRDDTFGKNKK